MAQQGGLLLLVWLAFAAIALGVERSWTETLADEAKNTCGQDVTQSAKNCSWTGAGGAFEWTSQAEPNMLPTLVYLQGRGISKDQVVQLHIGSYVALSPQVVGPAATFTISPSLPQGLGIDAASGRISGTPKEARPKQTYQVCATPQAGSPIAGAHSKKANCTELQLQVMYGKLHTVASNLGEAGDLCEHEGKIYIARKGGLEQLEPQTGSSRKLMLQWRGRHGREFSADAERSSFYGVVLHAKQIQTSVHAGNLHGQNYAHSPDSGGAQECPAGPLPSAPRGMASLNGMLLVTSTEGHRIYGSDTEVRQWFSFAGSGTQGFSGDGGWAANAQLSEPWDLLAIGSHLYVADTGNHRIRVIDMDEDPPTIDTFAGCGSCEGRTSGAPAKEWEIPFPRGLAFMENDGKMYVTADAGNGDCFILAIDMQKPYHPAVMIAGGSGQQDLISATGASLQQPRGILALDGALYITQSSSLHRLVVGSTSIPTVYDALLRDSMPFLGAWATFNRGSTSSQSPFVLPLGHLFSSPQLPSSHHRFNFSISFTGVRVPKFLLGVGSDQAIEAALTGTSPSQLEEKVGLSGCIFIPHGEAANQQSCMVWSHSPELLGEVMAGKSVDSMQKPGRPQMQTALQNGKNLLTGVILRKQADRASRVYILKDVTLNGQPISTLLKMVTPNVPADTTMHLFLASLDQKLPISIDVESPPVLELARIAQ